VITDSQVGIQRPSGLRRSETVARRGVVGLVADHFIAKLVALLLAGALVVLIDREITVDLVDGELFDVRLGDLPQGPLMPGQRVIILEKEPSVAIRSFQPSQVRVTIRGQQKITEQIKTRPLVGVVSIKKDWLKKDKDGTYSTSQAIDGDSVKFDLSGSTKVKLDQPIQVDLDPEWSRDVPLVGQPQDVAPGLVADVTFQPAKVKVFGPSSCFEGGGAVDKVTVAIPTRGRTGEFLWPVTALPEDLVLQKRLRLAPGQQITATVKFSNAEQKQLEVKDVPIKGLMSSRLAADYTYSFVGLPREQVTVTVSGTAEALAAWNERLEDLKKAIQVQIDVDRIVTKVAAQLTEGGKQTDEYGQVEILKLPENLKLVGVTPAQVDVTITKR
jgi:hypothetical protein